MIRGIYLNGFADDWNDCLTVRQQVYLEDYNENVEVDPQDQMALQVILYDNEEKPVGSARLMFDMYGMFEFDRLCVLHEHRKNGYADFIMHMLFDKARMSGATHLVSKEISHHPEYFDKYGFTMKDGKMVLDLNEYFNKHRCCH